MSELALPDFITFTGVDEYADPRALRELASDYPVEFGLLFSPSRQGLDPRYPPIEVIAWLVSGVRELRWSAHFCGGVAREIIERGVWLHGDLLPYFKRVQINTADPSVEPSAIAREATARNLRAILQVRGSFWPINNVDLLFDCSGGRGILSDFFPQRVNSTFCGYAGGLNPENVARVVDRVGAPGGPRYWLDMESGVRDEDDRFSVDKARAVCEAVYGKPRP